MKFGEIPLAAAEGAILAHSLKHAGGVFKKGRVLSAADIAALGAAGHRAVFAARLEAGDVGEDEAATAVAQAIAGPGAVVQAAFTGRANLHAAAPGLAVVDGARITAFNRLNESLTIATLSPFAPVAAKQLIATVKVIPYAVPRPVLEAGLALIGREPLLRVAPVRARRVGLVITGADTLKPSLVAKTEEVTRERLRALGGDIGEVARVPHGIAGTAAAIVAQAAAGCEPILVFGAQAIVDRGDVVPAGLVAAGGEVVHLGMPVDPGNLLMLGRLGKTPVIGVPTCARSPKLNGFDWVLQRLMADVPVTGADIAAMGAGGLLAEIPSRPAPREGTVAAPMAPRVAAIVLAAGKSSRMGANKLLADVAGKPMLRHTVEAVAAAQVDRVIVVTGRDAPQVTAALAGLAAETVFNADYAQGLSTSLRAGLAAAGGATALLIALGDMPRVSPAAINRLIAAFNPAERRAICVPTFAGKRGNPVLWSSRYAAAMQALTGDKGARELLDDFAEDVVEVAMPDDAVLDDIDTPEALARLRSGPAA